MSFRPSKAQRLQSLAQGWWRGNVTNFAQPSKTENFEIPPKTQHDGPRPGRRRLFVIDRAKALRCAIDRVYGAAVPKLIF